SMKHGWWFLLFFFLVMFFKVFAMSFTNAGGGVGGTFGPTLIVGGLAGFVVAESINLTGIHTLPQANFVLVGMAGLMAGVMAAPMTAIFLIAEITGGYGLLMPLIITSLVSYATIRIFEPYSIYSKRLAKRGELLTHDSDSAVLTLLQTSSLVEKDFMTLGMEDSLGKMVKAVEHSKRNLFPVVDAKGEFQGYISLDDIRQIMFDTSKYESLFAYNLMRMSPDYILEDEKMESVMEKFERTGAWNLPVLDRNRQYLGFVSKSKIFSSYRSRLREVSQE
ncbi:MAG: chloride channel protein, partial [Alistipes sp.]|nr:chloride channel protein [Candidatus Minthomonas equi]